MLSLTPNKPTEIFIFSKILVPWNFFFYFANLSLHNFLSLPLLIRCILSLSRALKKIQHSSTLQYIYRIVVFVCWLPGCRSSVAECLCIKQVVLDSISDGDQTFLSSTLLKK